MRFLPQRSIADLDGIIKRCPYTENILQCLRNALEPIPGGAQAPQGPPWDCRRCELGAEIRRVNTYEADDPTGH